VSINLSPKGLQGCPLHNMAGYTRKSCISVGILFKTSVVLARSTVNPVAVRGTSGLVCLLWNV